MTEPVKHAPQTRGTRLDQCARSRRLPQAPAAFTPFMTLSPAGSGSVPQDGSCGAAGEERPHGLHRQQHAVRVGRLPGERASPAQVCAASATASSHSLSSEAFLLLSSSHRRPDSAPRPRWFRVALHSSNFIISVSDYRENPEKSRESSMRFGAYRNQLLGPSKTSSRPLSVLVESVSFSALSHCNWSI